MQVVHLQEFMVLTQNKQIFKNMPSKQAVSGSNPDAITSINRKALLIKALRFFYALICTINVR